MSNQSIKSNDEAQRVLRDPMGVIPNIEWSFSNVAYGLCIAFSLMIIAYGLAIHFRTFGSEYYPEVATVINVDCSRFPVNNHRSEYHCVLGLEYPTSPDSDDTTTNSMTFVDSERFFAGDQIEILVNRYNTLDIKYKVISDENLAIIYCICGLLLLIIVTGFRFMRIT